MNIKWNISKKRGNIRPVLTYTITLDEHEKALALPPLRLVSRIPEPDESWQEHCYPGQHERAMASAPERSSGNPEDNLLGNSPANAPGKFHDLEVPSHEGHSWTHSLRLPWRENNSYPEVESSFRLLRDAFEKELATAYASQPMQEENSLQTSVNAKAGLAPGVLAERFLKLARGNMQKTG